MDPEGCRGQDDGPRNIILSDVLCETSMSFDHFISFETFRFVLTPVCGNKNTEILLDKFLIGLIV